MSEEEFLLKWNNHQSNFVDVFSDLLRDEAFVDVTLVCGGEAVPGMLKINTYHFLYYS